MYFVDNLERPGRVHGVEVSESLQGFPAHEGNLLLTQGTRDMVNILRLKKIRDIILLFHFTSGQRTMVAKN